MGLQISLGIQQQLIVLVVSLPLSLHPSPTFKLLSTASYSSELVLDLSSP